MNSIVANSYIYVVAYSIKCSKTTVKCYFAVLVNDKVRTGPITGLGGYLFELLNAGCCYCACINSIENGCIADVFAACLKESRHIFGFFNFFLGPTSKGISVGVGGGGKLVIAGDNDGDTVRNDELYNMIASGTIAVCIEVMTKRVNGGSNSRNFCAASLCRAVNYVLVAAFFSTGSVNFVFNNCFRIGVTGSGNSFWCFNRYATNRALNAVGETVFGTSRSFCGNGFFGVAEFFGCFEGGVIATGAFYVCFVATLGTGCILAIEFYFIVSKSRNGFCS